MGHRSIALTLVSAIFYTTGPWLHNTNASFVILHLHSFLLFLLFTTAALFIPHQKAKELGTTKPEKYNEIFF